MDETFTLITTDDSGEVSEKSISIKALRSAYKHDSDCRHYNIEVDEELWNITCLDCGKELNPIYWFVNMSGKEVLAEYRLDQLNKEFKRRSDILAIKSRTRCEHCGKMTIINTDTDIKKIGLLLRYVDTKKNGELNKRSFPDYYKGLRDDGYINSEHEFYFLRETPKMRIYVCKYCGKTVTES